ncbi:unnamed protein product [Vitrella brassicaformis CCMP3155]|uniref:Uncharacterized protein n=1 Tax=Vitrella brassicaformis (strain CCMP3155) TaxID=1169540 RepID=A0A0G4G345_VITBC|nr:unnamed protein product [Vitrella brassicaformis CCMP3155]|eukprot:CEM22669.1 unnamed protein product [Vitrella brassicaformis CCMP3155]
MRAARVLPETAAATVNCRAFEAPFQLVNHRSRSESATAAAAAAHPSRPDPHAYHRAAGLYAKMAPATIAKQTCSPVALSLQHELAFAVAVAANALGQASMALSTATDVTSKLDDRRRKKEGATFCLVYESGKRPVREGPAASPTGHDLLSRIFGHLQPWELSHIRTGIGKKTFLQAAKRYRHIVIDNSVESVCDMWDRMPLSVAFEWGTRMPLVKTIVVRHPPLSKKWSTSVLAEMVDGHTKARSELHEARRAEAERERRQPPKEEGTLESLSGLHKDFCNVIDSHRWRMPSLRHVQGHLVGETFTCEFLKTSRCLESLDVGQEHAGAIARVLQGCQLSRLTSIGTISVHGASHLDQLRVTLSSGGCTSLQSVTFLIASIDEDTVASLNAMEAMRTSGVATCTAAINVRFRPRKREQDMDPFSLSILHNCPAISLSSPFVRDKLCKLAKSATSIVWHPDEAYLTNPHEIGDHAKQLAAMLRFPKARALDIGHLGEVAAFQLPAASSHAWSPLAHLSVRALPKTLAELHPTGRFGFEAVRLLAAAGKIKNVKNIHAGHGPRMPAGEIPRLLAAMKKKRVIDKVDVKVTAEGTGIMWGDEAIAETLPCIRHLAVDLTVPDDAAAAPFVYASVTSCVKIRGLRQVAMRVYHVTQPRTVDKQIVSLRHFHPIDGWSVSSDRLWGDGVEVEAFKRPVSEVFQDEGDADLCMS